MALLTALKFVQPSGAPSGGEQAMVSVGWGINVSSKLDDGTADAHQNIIGAGSNDHAAIDTHLGSSANPHSVTQSQVGLGNVTNDAQLIKAIGTAKGDIIVYTATNTPIRLPIGTDDFVLTSDAAQASGVKWAAAVGGGETLAQTLVLGNVTGGTNIEITPGDSIVTPNGANGGDLPITLGDGTAGQGGEYIVRAGDGGGGSVPGGKIDLLAGNGALAGVGGSVFLVAGIGGATGGTGGFTLIEGGGGGNNNGDGGKLFLSGGQGDATGNADGGDVDISGGAGFGTGVRGAVTLNASINTITGTIATIIEATTSVLNAPVPALVVQVTSDGDIAGGFGTSIEFKFDDTGAGPFAMGRMYFERGPSDVLSNFHLEGSTGGTTRILSISNTGQTTLNPSQLAGGDFIVHNSGSQNGLYFDAGTGKFGIQNGAPTGVLTIHDNGKSTISMLDVLSDDAQHQFRFANETFNANVNNGFKLTITDAGLCNFANNNIIVQSVSSNGSFIFNPSSTADANVTMNWDTGVGFLMDSTDGKVTLGGDLNLDITGKGIGIKAGAATDSVGTATLVAGTVTISNTNIATGDKIFLSRFTVGGTIGTLDYTIINATSFTINSSDSADTSVVDYIIVRAL